METTKTVWDLVEEAPDYADDVAELYHWSTNYDAGEGPFTLYLDLIGWSDEEIGRNLYNQAFSVGLGYVELDKLAKALIQYADRPTMVREFVDALLAAEATD